MTRLQYKYIQPTEEIFISAETPREYWIVHSLNNLDARLYKKELFRDLLEHGQIQIGEDIEILETACYGGHTVMVKRK